MKEVGTMSHTISLPIVRFSLAGFISLLITFMLFFLMQDLIRSTGDEFLEDPIPNFELKYVRIKQEEVVNPIDRLPPPVIEQQPPPPQTQLFDDPIIDETGFYIGEVEPVIDINPKNIGIYSSGEGDILPIIKVQPTYPITAITKGIEGYVIVEFTVTSIGTTSNISVIEAVPSSIFNQSSIKAAARFKYKPRVIDGTPIEVRGVQNKFIFQLE